MKKLGLSKEIEDFSLMIAVRARNESEFLPVDRYFLEKFITQINSFDKQEFLLCNFENVNPTYTVHLMLCLPDLWETVTVDDVIELIYNFTNPFSYYAIVEFMYTYIEVDIITLIMELPFVEKETKKDLLLYFNDQYMNYFKEEDDVFFTENIYGVTLDQWSYVKQIFLLDNRIQPALSSPYELKEYIEVLKKKYL